MVCAPTSNGAGGGATINSDVAAYLVERNYSELGCNRWDTRRVRVLLAKLGETPVVLAMRLRIKLADFERRMEADCWTKQDGLILTMIEREVDFSKGGIVAKGALFFSTK